MLETRNLVKIYRPKKGTPVTALDNISLQFPEKGMVFLLGKSGSGKSTLLNVLGGLDRYDGGEILIKGVSSKSFRQKHFDSYRNTYVGFIFQEYNVLDEFSVGANIALALELQNRKATDEQINEILKEVDLEGFGNRKPNELSGGQKQRVAIARALVKKPEIIMADEPTGALDSGTGRQVFDTLKKLSKTRLVIVVSHDREFAEQYADRIIELSDGRVISDVESTAPTPDGDRADALTFHEHSIEVPKGYHLTEQDRQAINDYIERLSNGAATIHISESGNTAKRFVQTDTAKIKPGNGDGFRLIQSKLPLKNAFKIGASGLKHKKIRLVVTILLSCISFGLFGLSDTFGAYNHVKTCTNSLVDSDVNYLSVAKAKRVENGANSYWQTYGYLISENNLAEISSGIGVQMHGVYRPDGAELSFESQINPDKTLSETDYQIYSPCFSGGFAEISDAIIAEMGFTLLAGKLPNGEKNEIAVSEYIYEVFRKADYFDGVSFTANANGEELPLYQKITKYSDLIGKTITLNNVKYTVTAVIDTNFALDRYVSLTEKKSYRSNAEKMVDYVLYNEYATASAYSYAGNIMVGTGGLSKMIKNRPPMAKITEGYLSFYNASTGCSVNPSYMARLADIKNESVIWLDGEKKTLGDKEIIVTADSLAFEGDNDDNPIDYTTLFKNKNSFTAWENIFSNDQSQEIADYKIVGVIDNRSDTAKSRLNMAVVCSDSLFAKFTEGTEPVYAFAVGAMPQSKEDVRMAVAYCYKEDTDLRYQIQNSVTFELDSVNDVLKSLSTYFFWIGVGFAAFAALMLANFIGTSISYKKQEIGILRAIGSRSNDVFRIFFAESFIIAMINFVLSSAGVFAVTAILNGLLRKNVGLLITVLNFTPRQLLLLLAVSLLVAFIASFLPVKRIASKRPIDAIRDR